MMIFKFFSRKNKFSLAHFVGLVDESTINGLYSNTQVILDTQFCTINNALAKKISKAKIVKYFLIMEYSYIEFELARKEQG